MRKIKNTTWFCENGKLHMKVHNGVFIDFLCFIAAHVYVSKYEPFEERLYGKSKIIYLKIGHFLLKPRGIKSWCHYPLRIQNNIFY